jgi:histidine triad (HIT) family protein
MAQCIFCRIARGEVEARVVFQDEQAVAFHDLGPQAPVHVLIIPRRHLANLAVASPDDEALLGHLLQVARQLGEELGVAGSGYRVVLNVGPHAGQSVDHLHVHLLGGRGLGWPPG